MRPITTILSIALVLCSYHSELTAQCISGDCQNGDGVYTLPSGARYFGGFKDGEIHGHGICKYPDGSVYDGQWVYRFPEGRGTLTYPDGIASRSGYWKKGQPVDINGNLINSEVPDEVAKNYNTNIQSGCISGNCWNGKGIFAYPDGSKYRGDFLAGKLDGWGSFYYLNGDKYVGEFKRGLPDGRGAMHYDDGAQRSGDWMAGEFVGSKQVHQQRTGCIRGDCYNGLGAYVFPDGKGKYSGTFSKGLPHGEGKVEYKNGDRYEGQLVRGKLNGKGTYYYATGKISEGYWKDGSYAGRSSIQNLGTYKEQPAAPRSQSRYSDSSAPNAPKVWAVIVGIANYNHMPILRYTDDDAYRMFAFFKSPEGGALSSERIRILIDEDATKNKIKDAMKEVFSKAGPDDLVILYFSGHGLKGAFLPIDYDGFNNKIYHEEITSLLKASPAKHKLCIADACHSGSLLAMRNGSVESVLSSYYDNLAKSSPSTALIMSSKSEETSLESNSLRQGVFSHFLIKGLEGEADANRDRVVGIQELFDYVRSNVRSYTGMRQSPILQGNYDLKMPVAVVR